MRMPSFLASAVFAAATVLGMGAASANTIVDGVSIPSSFYFDTSTSYETAVTSVGDILRGVFNVSQISASNNASITYHYGDNGKYVMGYFDNFKLAAITPNQTGTQTTLTFTGGELHYYVANSDVFTNSAGSVDADIAAASSGTLLLNATPVDLGGGITLVIDLKGINPTVTSFVSSSAFALADVDPSTPLGALLNSNGFQLGADLLFGGSASLQSGPGACGPDFTVCGSNNVSANLVNVPEPVTLSIFGAGLVGAAALRRRKAKKA